jgi:hypothetical protein
MKFIVSGTDFEGNVVWFPDGALDSFNARDKQFVPPDE